MHPAEFGNLAAWHILVEIAEACQKEADVFTKEDVLLPKRTYQFRGIPKFFHPRRLNYSQLGMDPAQFENLTYS